MILTQAAIAYGGVLVTYLVLDAIWLGLVSKGHYEEGIGHLMRESFPTTPWVLFYVMYSAAVVYLVVLPNQAAASVWPVLVAGAVFGAAAYGTYNLTCYAILEGWPLNITIMDLVWGTCVTAVCSLSGFYALKWFAP